MIVVIVVVICLLILCLKFAHKCKSQTSGQNFAATAQKRDLEDDDTTTGEWLSNYILNHLCFICIDCKFQLYYRQNTI